MAALWPRSTRGETRPGAPDPGHTMNQSPESDWIRTEDQFLGENRRKQNEDLFLKVNRNKVN